MSVPVVMLNENVRGDPESVLLAFISRSNCRVPAVAVGGASVPMVGGEILPEDEEEREEDSVAAVTAASEEVSEGGLEIDIDPFD